MRKMTEENAKAALAGESQAHIKYLAFAEKAAAESLPNVARAFKANSYAEQVHAVNHLRSLGGIGTTADNLTAAIDGESFEVAEMYPAYITVAEAQGERTALTNFKAAMAAEKVHAGIYERAREAVASGKDIAAEAIHVCAVCGFTMEGQAPDTCPVCGAPKDKFALF
ncbi:MAG: rubrerythrin family protein [Candidatus Aminicenantes bacterium]